jgi:hypothetical protein
MDTVRCKCCFQFKSKRDFYKAGDIRWVNRICIKCTLAKKKLKYFEEKVLQLQKKLDRITSMEPIYSFDF